MRKIRKSRNTKGWKTITQKKDFLNSLMDDKKKTATSYVKENVYEVGDYISHSKFGLGFIHNILNKDKIEVFFKESERILVQNWSKEV